MKSTTNKIVSEVLRWFCRNRRDLPWRKTRNPYRILVSEIMLQQTQVSRVEAKYPEFLRRFPTFEVLAKATKAEVLRAWSGMGYNNRALQLRETARIVVERFNGKLPNSIELLQQLPGVGRYTAHALSCFAHRERVPVVETNVRRVLSRVFWRTTSSTARRDMREVWRLASVLLPKHRPADWNLALMDLGSTVCKAGTPRCSECPVRRLCRSAFRIKRARSPIPRQEPVYQGLPRRYYRGRIIEALRNVNHGGWIPTRRLGPLVKQDFKLRELSWLHSLLRKLQHDGLIEIRVGKKEPDVQVTLAD